MLPLLSLHIMMKRMVFKTQVQFTLVAPATVREYVKKQELGQKMHGDLINFPILIAGGMG